MSTYIPSRSAPGSDLLFVSGLTSRALDGSVLGAGDPAVQARTIFAALSLILAAPSTGAQPTADPSDELRGQVAQIVRGFLATVQQ